MLNSAAPESSAILRPAARQPLQALQPLQPVPPLQPDVCPIPQPPAGQPLNLAALSVLAVGRASLMLCSVASIRLSTSQLGAAEMGVMNLLLNTFNLFGLLVAAFSLFFYRQVVEWHIERRLLKNLGRYARFLFGATVLVSIATPLLYLPRPSPWNAVAAPWLVALVAGNIFIVAMNGAVLYCLNATGRRRSYVLLSNLTNWGGLVLAAAACFALQAHAQLWLAGLLCGQAISLGVATLLLVGSLDERAAVPGSAAALASGASVAAQASQPSRASPTAQASLPSTASPAAQAAQGSQAQPAEDFRFRSVLAFAWPLVICTGLYWVQRSSYAPWVAATAGTPTLGLFSVAFSVGLLGMGAFDTLFTEYYAPIFYRSIAGGDAAKRAPAWNRYASAFFPALAVTFVFVAANGAALLELLVHPDFHGLAWVVACGAASQVLISIYSMHVLLASSFMDNRTLIVPNVAGAAVTLAALAVLLRWDAMLGSAVAVNAGLLTTVILASLRMKRAYGIRGPTRRVMLGLASALPMVAIAPVVGGLMPPGQPMAGAVVTLVIAALYMAAVQLRLARAWL